MFIEKILHFKFNMDYKLTDAINLEENFHIKENPVELYTI